MEESLAHRCPTLPQLYEPPRTSRMTVALVIEDEEAPGQHEGAGNTEVAEEQPLKRRLRPRKPKK